MLFNNYDEPEPYHLLKPVRNYSLGLQLTLKPQKFATISTQQSSNTKEASCDSNPKHPVKVAHNEA